MDMWELYAAVNARALPEAQAKIVFDNSMWLSAGTTPSITCDAASIGHSSVTATRGSRGPSICGFAGQRTCRTPKVKSLDTSTTFVAIAREYHNYGGGYQKISENQTARTR